MKSIGDGTVISVDYSKLTISKNEIFWGDLLGHSEPIN
jgi:hypothetical protein